MKNIKNLLASAALASLALVGCQKETNDPLLQKIPNEASFKGAEEIVDTIYIAGLSVGPRYTLQQNNRNGGWGFRVHYAGEGAGVSIKDQHGNLVQGVNVTGQFAGCFSGTYSKNTDQSGIASFKVSNSAPSSCTSTFTVTSVVKSGYYYNPAINVATSGSKVYP